MKKLISSQKLITIQLFSLSFRLLSFAAVDNLHQQDSIDKASQTQRLLMKNFKKLQLDPLPGIITAPQDGDIMIWNAIINGPDDTPWSGGMFKLTLQFPPEYPAKPPRVRFVSQMFHPNIYEDGGICLDVLQDQWSPALSRIESVLLSIQSLLSDANPDSPVNSEAARLFSENKREYNRRVREVVEQSQKRL